MEAILAELLAAAHDPSVIRMMAHLAGLAPKPGGPILAAVLQLYAAFLESGMKVEEINAIIAKASAECQLLANDWE